MHAVTIRKCDTRQRCNRSQHVVSRALAAALLVCFAPLAVAGGSFTGLGFLGSDSSTYPYGISANGLVVVGQNSLNSSGESEAFRWTQSGGMQSFGYGTVFSGASAANADGSVLVGSGLNANSDQIAVRWTQADGMVALNDIAGGSFVGDSAHDLSADGTVVVGSGVNANGFEAYRWTQTGGLQGLGDLPGGLFESYSSGVSDDGSVVVGMGSSASGREAFRWTQTGGLQGLGNLAGVNGIGNDSYANAISADGSMVVGHSFNASGELEAFRWTQTNGMQGLGFIEGGENYSSALGVNADGSVVVGIGFNGGDYTASRWTPTGGMQSVDDWLTASGVTLPSGWKLLQATGVSADGSVVVGYGENPNGYGEAWRAEVTVVPLPAAVWLFGSGLIGLLSIARYKKRPA